MSRESLGVVKLEWTCPKCGSRNPGPEKTCLSCGAPQPQDVQFEKAADQELITDDEVVQKAKAGPDIHCAFCGARNSAGSEVCTQCGADLVHGTKREAGRVIGAYQSAPIPQVACPNCGTDNPETALKCASCGASLGRAPQAAAPKPPAAKAAPGKRSPLAMIAMFAVVVLVVICVIAAVVMLTRPTASETAVVQSVDWVTTVFIEALKPVTRETWQEEIPAEAEMGACSERVHHVQDEPAPNANQVCGTPYEVDTGSGYAVVVQDCRYEVLEQWCQYTVMEWGVVDQARLQGMDFSPQYARPQLQEGQRLGGQEVNYTVVFRTSEDTYTYTTSSLEDFQRYQIGSEWVLTTNALGGLISIEPAQ